MVIEEEYWRQKAGMSWFKEGDRNTKFFHSYVRGRRKKLRLDRIKDIRGHEVTNNFQMGEAAIEYFQGQFLEEGSNQEVDMLHIIPKLIEDGQNVEMIELPSNEEV